MSISDAGHGPEEQEDIYIYLYICTDTAHQTMNTHRHKYGMFTEPTENRTMQNQKREHR